ncbi:membrane protein [Liberibacter crescens]|nr:membrane protein [Liberibacter crescens]
MFTFFVTFALMSCSNKKNDINNGIGFGRGAGSIGSVQPGSLQEFTVNVGDRVFFDTDSSSIRPDGIQTLARQVQWLRHYPHSVVVEGHSDERGTREYNLALGARRAEAVRSYLVSQGISSSRVRIISYGKEKPVAIGDDTISWSKNRRAVTVLR